MQVVLISKKTGKTRTFDIMPRHWVFSGCLVLFLLFFGSAFFSWLSVHLRLPLIQDLVFQAQARVAEESQQAVQNNLQLMAARLGELQAQLQEVKNIGERLSTSIPPSQSARKKPDGQGGPYLPAPLTEELLHQEIEFLARDIERRNEQLSLLESKVVEERVLSRFLPTTLPVNALAMGSGFGFRIDPFNNHRSMHEGLDFTANIGTPVVAAAGGIVVGANYHKEYGNLVVIDHGVDLVTRYAHLSRMDVAIGQQVKQGQRIGAVGNTGRSTGAHLHFEVRSQGVPLNPANFLRQHGVVAQRGK